MGLERHCSHVAFEAKNCDLMMPGLQNCWQFLGTDGVPEDVSHVNPELCLGGPEFFTAGLWIASRRRRIIGLFAAERVDRFCCKEPLPTGVLRNSTPQ